MEESKRLQMSEYQTVVIELSEYDILAVPERREPTQCYRCSNMRHIACNCDVLDEKGTT